MSLIPGSKSWCVVSPGALRANVQIFKKRIGSGPRLGVVVKSNAYGHGLACCAKVLVAAGADWLIVNDVAEALELRSLGHRSPIYVCGPMGQGDASALVEAQARVVVSGEAEIAALAREAVSRGAQVPVHVKLETGAHRQGITTDEAIALVHVIRKTPGVLLEGVTTHFADVEDTTNHRFAEGQWAAFDAFVRALREAGVAPKLVHSANSAAAILWPKTHGDLVRIGIATYGLWPSRETYATALQTHAEGTTGFLPKLEPALSWYTRIVQVKRVEAGSYVGYGRTFRTTHEARIALLPVGYYEGYSRQLSNVAHVLVNGVRAPVRGRICMNMMMVDVTHVPGAEVGTTVTLLGRDGDEEVSAELLAQWAQTINYEIVSGIHSGIPRVLADAG